MVDVPYECNYQNQMGIAGSQVTILVHTIKILLTISVTTIGK